MKDYHAILHISATAGKPEIQTAFRKLAKQYHPDVNKSQNAQAAFCDIYEAYAYLMRNEQAGIYTRDTSQPDEASEQFIREARDRAKAHAKMRYEKFKQQHEAFQANGINDLGLLFTIIGRVIALLLCVFLTFLPLVLAWIYGWTLLGTVFLAWPFAAILAWYIHDNRKNYFKPGRFYYTPGRIRSLFTHVRPTGNACYYCPSRLADSLPGKVELYLLTDLKFGTGGFRQHNVNYINKNVAVMIPRCHKAFVVHTVAAVMRILSIFTCMLFFPVTSLIWRFIAGTLSGMVLTFLLFTLLSVRSNNSYLISAGMVIRFLVWLICIFLASRFSMHPFNIITTDSIQFVLTAILIFDCFLMQFLDFLLGKSASRPIFRQYPEVSRKMAENYHAYNDIPFISVLYPAFRWYLG